MFRLAECLRVPPECLGTAQGGAANVVPRDLAGRVALPGGGELTFTVARARLSLAQHTMRLAPLHGPDAHALTSFVSSGAGGALAPVAAPGAIAPPCRARRGVLSASSTACV